MCNPILFSGENECMLIVKHVRRSLATCCRDSQLAPRHRSLLALDSAPITLIIAPRCYATLLFYAPDKLLTSKFYVDDNATCCSTLLFNVRLINSTDLLLTFYLRAVM